MWKIILLVLLVWLLLLHIPSIPIAYSQTPQNPLGSEISPLVVYSIEQTLERFGGGEWTFVNKIVEKESNWRHWIKNPKSSAWGLCQTMLSVHEVSDTFKDNPYEQVDWCLDYISDRYDTPSKAWKFHVKHNYF